MPIKHEFHIYPWVSFLGWSYIWPIPKFKKKKKAFEIWNTSGSGILRKQCSALQLYTTVNVIVYIYVDSPI